MKNALPPGRAFGLYSHTAEAYYNTDSVVYYDSTFSQKKQENDKFARFLAFTEPGSCIVMAEKDKFPYFLVYSAANFELHPRRKDLHNPVHRATIQQLQE